MSHSFLRNGGFSSAETNQYYSCVPAETVVSLEFRMSADDDQTNDNDGGPQNGVVIKTRPKTKRPSMYKVLMLNDDYTPMEFVVDILQRFFAMDRTKATRVMLEVHTKGKGVCGVFTYEIAETKVAQVIAYARQHQHPLMATLEEA